MQDFEHQPTPTHLPDISQETMDVVRERLGLHKSQSTMRVLEGITGEEQESKTVRLTEFADEVLAEIATVNPEFLINSGRNLISRLGSIDPEEITQTYQEHLPAQSSNNMLIKALTTPRFPDAAPNIRVLTSDAFSIERWSKRHFMLGAVSYP